MILIGVVGPSGSGKSTLCNFFRDAGHRVFELDRIAKQFYPQAATKVRDIFGSDVIKADGTIDSHALGKIVFANRSKMDQLNEIMFPLIFNGFFGPIVDEAASTSADGRITVFDAPMLYETKYWWIGMDYILFVDAPLDLRIKRLIEGRGIEKSTAEIQAGIFNYEKVKLRKQDVSIDNSKNPKGILTKLEVWLQEIKKPEYNEDSDERYTGWSNLAL